MEDCQSHDNLDENHEETRLKAPWTKFEESKILCRLKRQSTYNKYKREFTEGILLKLRESIFGTYLDIFNSQQNPDNAVNNLKLDITEFDMRNYKRKDFDRFQRNNDFIENGFQYLKNIIKDGKPISLNYLRNNIRCLKLNSLYITHVDNMVSKFKLLQILSLHSNNIRVLDGSVLPRSLKYLELYDNFLASVQELCNNPPKHILHIGLGRNCLNDASCLHLLPEHFQSLKSIDLSDNEISSLDVVTKDIKDLKLLKSLQIEGNPCYVYQNYPQAVLQAFPEIQYLDGREILPTDITANLFNIEPGSPELTFYCYRILALQEPPKDQKHTQAIHLEVDLPLLQPHSGTKEKRNVPSNMSHSPKHPMATPSKESPKKASPYNKPHEIFQKFCFKTEHSVWSKSIEFPVVEISSPENKPENLRDTFRSYATVRIVYLKTERPKITENKTSHTNISAPEKIIKRVTIGSFKCNLETLSWSDGTLDFYWADHLDVGNNAIKVDGCLKDLEYEGVPKAKKTSATVKMSTAKMSTAKMSVPRTSAAKTLGAKTSTGKISAPGTIQAPILPYPKFLTCHVGFGLKRI